MADTLTYQNDNDPVTTEESLTTEEQESLKVGEALQEEQEQLLAGKYKDAEELEKAYVELQKKLGEKGTEDSENSGESEDNNESEETTEEEKETKEDSPAVTLINEASTEYWNNDRELSQETLDKFNDMSSKDLLAAYLEVQKNSPEPSQEIEQPDLNQSDINSVQQVVGGEAEYNKVIQWASSNLAENDIKSFDDLISTGNLGAIKLAVNGLKAQYDNANGYEGRMLSGKSPRTSGEVFRSQAELVQAMGDPRYDNDPAYRQDVIDKLERSDNLQF
tara:strand:- start:391 stop:1221 length:831 start_codon:yes stop_codon:yes gene_type:complete